MERQQNNEFLSEMKILFKDKIIFSNLKYKILKIKEENFEEYYLTLELKNECIIEGIYIKTKELLKHDQIIDKCIFILDELKSEIQIKEIFSILSNENIIINSEEKEKEI